MKRFILPIVLVGVMVTAAGGIGVVVVKYAIDLMNPAGYVSYEEMEKLQEQGDIDEKEIPRLVACFERNDENLRFKSAETLAKMGTKAVAPVREKLKHPSAKVRYYAVQTFAFMDPKDAAAATPDLLICIDDREADVRRKAVYVLGRLGGKGEGVFTGMIKALGDADADVAAVAIAAIKKMDAPPKEALPALTKLADDPKHEVRAEAIKLLGKMGEPAVPAFKELLKKPDPLGRVVLIQAIAPLGSHAKDLLPELQAMMLENPWWDGEDELMRIFKNCGPDGAKRLADMLKAVHDPKSPHFANAGPRSAVLLKAIGDMGAQAKDATPMLIELLKDRDSLRPQVLETLGDIGPSAKDAIPAVEALTTDPRVGPAARATLKRMGVLN